MMSPSADFESATSTNSITPAKYLNYYTEITTDLQEDFSLHFRQLVLYYMRNFIAGGGNRGFGTAKRAEKQTKRRRGACEKT